MTERRRARRVRRDDAARKRAGERRRRRKPRIGPRERLLHGATGTPASTRMNPGPTSSMRVSFSVERTTSPIGVAPPVSEDCAPTARSVPARRTMSGTPEVARNGDRGGMAAGKVRRVREISRVHVVRFCHAIVVRTQGAAGASRRRRVREIPAA